MNNAVKNGLSFSPTQRCRLYLCLLLLVTVVISPPAGALFGLLLLALNVYLLFRTPKAPWPLLAAELNWYLLAALATPVTVSLANLWQTPPLFAQILAAVMLTPLLYLIDHSLQDYAARTTPVYQRTGRHLSQVARILFTTAVVMLLLAPVLDNVMLLLAGILQLVYLTGVTLLSLLQARTASLETSRQRRRIVAGRMMALSFTVSIPSAAKWYCQLSPADTVVSITQPYFTLNGTPREVDVTVKPGLAGPTYPEIRSTLGDDRGLLRIDGMLQPLEILVIPRARYARWLAEKYLSRVETNMTVNVPMPFTSLTFGRRGLEYQESHEYQPGDLLRDIDWKHTLKLDRLIVKQYAPETGRLAVIAVNLSATDAEAADQLAYNMVTTALTLAEEGIPAALTAYNKQEIILTLGANDPREILKQTLRLVRDIRLEPGVASYLQPPEPGHLRRDIARLKRVKTTPATRLRELLELEHRAVEGAAREHPATRALLRLAQDITPPAALILVSARTHDANALAVTADRLQRHGFSIIPVPV